MAQKTEKGFFSLDDFLKKKGEVKQKSTLDMCATDLHTNTQTVKEKTFI